MLILVTERRDAHRELIAYLRENGIYLFVSPYETAELLCRIKDTGGVILDGIANLSRAEKLCTDLREQYPEIPIAAIVAHHAIPNMPINRLLRATQSTDLRADVLDFCIRTCGWSAQRLSTYALTVGTRPEETYYMGYPLELSPREFSILHCIFYRSPRPTSTDDLMELCYMDGGQNIGNIAVQIRSINQKAAQIDKRPLIVNVYGKGYRLRNGII